MRRNINIIGMMALVITLSFPATRAFADESIPGDNGDGTCTVKDAHWSNRIIGDELTLPVAMGLANATDPRWNKWCRKGVTIEVSNTLQMLGPLTIIGGGAPDAPFRFHGKQKVEFDARSLSGKGPCAIVIGDPSGERGYIELDKISITGVPSDMSAICINDSSVTIKDVTVGGGKNGIVFMDNAKKGRIEPSAHIEVASQDGYAIDFGSPGSDSFYENFIIPLDEEISGGTNDDGIIPVTANADKIFVANNSSVTRTFKGASNVRACLAEVVVKANGPHSGKVEVRGFVLNAAEGADVLTADPAKNITRLQIYSDRGFEGYVGPYKQVGGEEVGMFRTRRSLPGGNDNDNSDRKTGQFRFYMEKRGNVNVGEAEAVAEAVAEAAEAVGEAVAEAAEAVGEEDANGNNEWSRIGVENNETEGEGLEIIVVPESVDHKIGSSSGKIRLTDNQTGECFDRQWIGYAGGSLGDEGGGLRAMSVEHCKRLRKIFEGKETGDLIPGFDTDGDGINDDQEDFNRNCRCEQEIGETCYYLKDSDRDGTPDGTGKEKPCNITLQDVEGGLDGKLQNGRCPGGDIYDPDKDGVPNALDPDSDGDGLPDRIEARNQAIVFTAGDESAQGLLYEFQKEAEDPVMIGGEVVKCPLGQRFEAGISYPWYTVTRDNNGVITAVERLGESIPQEGMPEDPNTPASADNAPGRHLNVMVCRIESLATSQNFDGVYSADNNEANPYDNENYEGRIVKAIDTDDDGFCDGDGPKCVRGAKPDKCPTIPGRGTEDGCGKDIPCMPKQPFYTTASRYIQRDDAGAPTGLKRVDGEGSGFKLFEENKDPVTGIYNYTAITNATGDMDKDGIPDIVENPYGGCRDEDTGLSFNKADSDDDGFIDGRGVGNVSAENSDVCPGNKGPNTDNFVDDPNRQYSCGNREQARQIYSVRPVLSCFLDRDHDGLRDCEEDIDMRGDYNNRQNIQSQMFEDGRYVGIDGNMIKTLETDPLAPDSDKDDITDFVERKSSIHTLADGTEIFTNPISNDTDGDTILDGKENRDGDQTYKVALMQGAEGCPVFGSGENAFKLDTDPTSADTDGDGLNDNVELDGDLTVGDVFINMIKDPELWNEVGGGINLVSNPRSEDSDNDGVEDGQEYNGLVTYGDSNPCMRDSDNDTIKDEEETPGCALNPDTTCVGGSEGGAVGRDGDSDGLPDSIEDRLGTDKNDKDSDDDGVLDGIEDANQNGIYEPNLGESNPMKKDTDEDGLSDGMELRYGTDPTSADTDGDCIPDGVEDTNRNGKREVSETDALSADSDGDGLPDGRIRGIGEDLNCSGTRDNVEGANDLESDPNNPDTDYDGVSDFDEMMDGGWNLANLNQTSARRGGGCSMMSDATTTPASLVSMVGLMLAAAVLVRRRMREKSPV